MPNLSRGESEETRLFRHVANCKGEVSPELARRFLNNLFYGGFDHIHPSLAHNGLRALPVEFRLNLYESIAKDNHPRNFLYLDALNSELGLTEPFFARQAKDVVSFFAKPWLGLTYAFKNWGQTYSGAMNRALRGEASETEKRKLIAHTVQAYFKHLGLPEPKIQYINAHPGLQGGCSPDGKVFSINQNSTGYRNDFSEVINMIFHESQHGAKHIRMARDYLAGKIKADHPDYIAARVFAANLANFGYITPSRDHEAYERQPMERDARYAGGLAQKLVIERYGDRTPAPRARAYPRPSSGFVFAPA